MPRSSSRRRRRRKAAKRDAGQWLQQRRSWAALTPGARPEAAGKRKARSAPVPASLSLRQCHIQVISYSGVWDSSQVKTKAKGARKTGPYSSLIISPFQAFSFPHAVSQHTWWGLYHFPNRLMKYMVCGTRQDGKRERANKNYWGVFLLVDFLIEGACRLL